MVLQLEQDSSSPSTLRKVLLAMLGFVNRC